MTKAERKADNRAAYEALMKFYPFTTDDLDGEQWAWVPNYDELYQESTFGRTKSFHKRKVTILSPKMDVGGYLCVSLSRHGEKKMHRVNRLVAQIFIPNPDNKPEVDHRNGCKLDNYVGNLRWATDVENKRYASEIGLGNTKGGDDSQAKLTDADAYYVRTNPDKLTRTQLAIKFGVHLATIRLIQIGKTYKAAGGTLCGIRKQKRPTFLTNAERDIIRSEYFSGYASTLAKKYNVSRQTILRIVTEK